MKKYKCIEVGMTIGFTKGKIYDVEEDGTIHYDTGSESMRKLENNKCWWSTFELVPQSQQQIHQEIKIFKSFRSNNVNALMYKDGKVVKSAVAKCHPDDKFNFEVGAKLAMERLMGKGEIKEEDFKIGDRVRLKEGGMHDWIKSNGT